MWTDLGETLQLQYIDCAPPYSFYFDLVEKYWRSSNDSREPLRRICAIARKMEARFVVIESAARIESVKQEIDELDRSQAQPGEAEAISISFFDYVIDINQLAGVPSENFLGQAILINYKQKNQENFLVSYVFESVFRIPHAKCTTGEHRLPLLNNYVCVDADFTRYVNGIPFSIKAVYYSQQNSRTNVCAHACLRMALNTYDRSTKSITNQYINEFLTLNFPINGLSLEQIKKIVGDCGIAASTADCSQMSYAQYMTVLHSAVESGYPALLVFSTGAKAEKSDVEHVVLVFGHTRNPDEWHPQAIPAYSGYKSAEYYPASAWAAHYLIHDDNFGPYFTLSSRALELNKKVKARWIVSFYPVGVKVLAAKAENIASIALRLYLRKLAKGASSQWLKHLTKRKSREILVLRTVLIKKEDYIGHMKSLLDHKKNKVGEMEIEVFDCLPELFWMVEFSLPHIYTGNNGKLGEVIVDAMEDYEKGLDAVVAIRLPELFISNRFGIIRELSITSHSPVYRHRDYEYQW